MSYDTIYIHANSVSRSVVTLFNTFQICQQFSSTGLVK